jgi:hypothetical protein
VDVDDQTAPDAVPEGPKLTPVPTHSL